MKLHVGIGTAADEIETVEILCYDNLEERDRGWKKTGRGKDRKYCNLFGMGLPVYHIDRMVKETGMKKMGGRRNSGKKRGSSVRIISYGDNRL